MAEHPPTSVSVDRDSGGVSAANRSEWNPNAPGADPLLTPVQFVRGVGPARAALLAKLELFTVQDLLFYVPRDVLDLSDVRDPSKLETDVFQSVRGTVVEIDSRPTRTGSMTGVLIRSGSDFVRGLWFNQPWMYKKFKHGDVLLMSGKPKRNKARWEFNNPHTQLLDLEDEDSSNTVAVLPRYGLTEGIRMVEMRRILRVTVEDFAHLIADRIPEAWRLKWKLPALRDALRSLHLPRNVAEFDAAKRRLIFEDLLEFQLAVAMRRRAWRAGQAAPVLPNSTKIDARIRRLFPFKFTVGQDRAVHDVARDLASGQAMHRLLQADVGAGKTAIAIYGLLIAVANGFQCVLMAPTELLASQHWKTIDRVLVQSRVTRVLLTGNLTAAQRRKTLEDIASGETQLIVGTQAVIQADIRFSKLGLAIIDEQHKFGVGQRAKFSQGTQQPHVLVMTATPIPRSLCLTQFGDLDLTVINELPPGRQPVRTWRVQDPATRTRAWKFIREQVDAGRQVYVVCPRVGDVDDRQSRLFDEDADSVENESKPPVRKTPSTEGTPAKLRDEATINAAFSGELLGATEEVYRQLKNGELKDYRIGIVHGQMDRQLKANAMEAFRTGETQILVSTTVVEVGVDVPNATIIVIQQAERFGLSQLHQLRGRVGRGQHQGYCFLFSDASAPEVVKRLQAMEKFSDGFQIAEADFELRGPGDILGTRQHGSLPLRVADLNRDRELVEEARDVAFALVDSGDFDQAGFVPLKIQVLDRFAQVMDLPRTG